MKEIKFKPVFVKTENVKRFVSMMDGLALNDGEGRLGVVYGRAGRGKTRTSQWYTAHNGCVYLRIATIWKSSEFNFLQDLCKELGVKEIPGRKGPCFTEAVERLISDQRPVFLDEPEKLSRYFLDVIRDLSDMSAAPFILIGEEELPDFMKRNRRVWSRCYQILEFEPINTSDIVSYVKESTGLVMSIEVSRILHKSSGGDFRLVRRDLVKLVQYANAKQTTEISKDMANMATKSGLKGE